MVVPAGFDAERQRITGFVAAGLDEQARELRRSVADLPVATLERQPGPGHNSIGMLLAHIAITEAWWLVAAPRETNDRAADEALVRAAIGLGLDDDGMPCAADGGHPVALAAWSASRYLATLAAARAHAHAVLAGWDDASLATAVAKRRGRPVTRGWIAYHVLEHYATHAGQIGRLLHDARDRANSS